MVSRPILITIIAVLYTILGVFGILSGVVTENGELFYATIAIGLIYLVIAAGLFGGWKIMWYIAIIFSIIGILVNLYAIFSGEMYTVIVSLLIGLVVIFYLTRPGVKEFFNI